MEGKGRHTIKSVEQEPNEVYYIITDNGEYRGWYDDDKTRFTFHKLDKDNERYFYDNQSIKNYFFGSSSWAIEVYPDPDEMVDGQPQTHLWLVNKNSIPGFHKNKEEQSEID